MTLKVIILPDVQLPKKMEYLSQKSPRIISFLKKLDILPYLQPFK